MIDTILFDLDGTLLQFSQEEFITTYFGKLKAKLESVGLDADRAIKAVWSGTKAMTVNDGTMLNSQRFWADFSRVMSLSEAQTTTVENACNSFYANEFDTVKDIIKIGERTLPARMVRSLAAKGYNLVLATNPMFPPCAVVTRLGWIGLSPDDFCLITDYTNSTYCKPSIGYYREILAKIGKEPHQCMMIGNNAREDMSAGALNIETFLVTNYLENEENADISAFRSGTLSELETFLNTLPEVN